MSELVPCGSCHQTKAVCFTRTYQTIYAGMHMVNLCQTCLNQMATALEVFTAAKSAAATTESKEGD